jgi:hypothetical protein
VINVLEANEARPAQGLGGLLVESDVTDITGFKEYLTQKSQEPTISIWPLLVGSSKQLQNV